MGIARLGGQTIPTRGGAKIRQRTLAAEVDIAEHPLCLGAALLRVRLDPPPQLGADRFTRFAGCLHERPSRSRGALAGGFLQQLLRGLGILLDSDALGLESRQRKLRVRVAVLRGAAIPRSRTRRVAGHSVALLVTPAEIRLGLGITHAGLHARPLEIPAAHQQEQCGDAPRAAKAPRHRAASGNSPHPLP